MRNDQGRPRQEGGPDDNGRGHDSSPRRENLESRIEEARQRACECDLAGGFCISCTHLIELRREAEAEGLGHLFDDLDVPSPAAVDYLRRRRPA